MELQGDRKRDSGASRARILSAAQCAFARTGYSHTGIRDVAAGAGTSSTLVLRYFGSKAGLFEAALRAALPLEELTRLPASEIAAKLLAMLREQDGTARAMMMIAMGSGEPEAAAIAARVFIERSLLPLAAAIDRPGDPHGSDGPHGSNGMVRSLELSMLTIGYAFFMKHLQLEVFCPEERDAIDAWVDTNVRELVDPSGV